MFSKFANGQMKCLPTLQQKHLTFAVNALAFCMYAEGTDQTVQRIFPIKFDGTFTVTSPCDENKEHKKLKSAFLDFSGRYRGGISNGNEAFTTERPEKTYN